MQATIVRHPAHGHVFLGKAHGDSERKTWVVIWLCAAMMVAEIVGGLLFGSIALVADGLHMSTHAGALLLAAIAYTYARRHADDPRFTFGTGKVGDLAGFTSAIVLAAIAVLIGYESVLRLFVPVPIRFAEAIPVACLGLAVNVASAWLLGAGGHHDHGHGHGHSHDGTATDGVQRLETEGGSVALEIFEGGVPPRFRLRSEYGSRLSPATTSIETVRPDGARQRFTFDDKGAYLESVEEIPEPHAFVAHVTLGVATTSVAFEEHSHAHGATAHDNNMRAALVHVVADAAVSVLVIVGLSLALVFGWLWMDPLAGIVGSLVIASWAFALVRDTGRILLDMNPDARMAETLRATIETGGDRLADLHLWRLGPGHLGAIVSVVTATRSTADDYKAKLARFSALSHVTVEVTHAA